MIVVILASDSTFPRSAFRVTTRLVAAAGLALLLLPLGVNWTHYFVLVIPVTALTLLGSVGWTARALGLVQLVLLFYPLHPLLFRTQVVPATVADAPVFWASYYFAPLVVSTALAFAALLDRGRGSPAIDR